MLNKLRPTLWLQRPALLTMILLIWLPTTLLLALVLYVSRVKGFSIGYFTRDPAAITGQPFYLGLVSNVGIIFWISAAAVCFFSYLALSGQERYRERRYFLLCSGILSAVLGLDDFFMFHEQMATVYFGLGERLIFGIYGLLTLVYLLRFRELILRSEYIVLITGFALFGLSILFDAIPPTQNADLNHILEDGPKFLGVATLMFYFVRTSLLTFKEMLRVQGASPSLSQVSPLAGMAKETSGISQGKPLL